jgi:hypothetical protein
MTCPIVFIVTNVQFDDINITPIRKSIELELGGEVADGGEVNEAGKYFSGSKKEPAKLKFMCGIDDSFAATDLIGRCGDLQILTSEGSNYLITEARLASTIKLKGGESITELEFIGSVAEEV